MLEAALLVTALMFGGTVLYSFGFAAFVFTSLPADTAGPLIRKAFPHFYLFVIGTSALAAGLLFAIDPISAAIMAAIAITTIPTRQMLMPAINAATDNGKKNRFKTLHSVSVVITLLHIVGAAIVIVRLA
ncbi:MAG: DUF4149 domain-containing protein [Pseudomonadota bacterium]